MTTIHERHLECMAAPCLPSGQSKLDFSLQVVVRLNLGIDASKNVAMKLAVRSSSEEISEVIHQIIQNA